MAISNFDLRRLDVYQESTFGLDHSGTPNDFLSVPFQSQGGLDVSIDQEILTPDTVQQYLHGRPLDILGRERANVSITLPLHCSGLAGDDATANGDGDSNALNRILETIFGGVRGGNLGSTVASASSASVFNVQAADGSLFTAGGAIGWVNSSGYLEIAEIESVSTDTITLKTALSGTPSTNDDILNATTFYLQDARKSLQFLYWGENAADYWSLRGGQMTGMSLNVGDNGIPTVQLDIRCAVAQRKGSGTLAAATYSNYQPINNDGGSFQMQTVGTATRNVVKLAGAPTFTPGWAWQMVAAPSGEGGYCDAVQTHAREGAIQGSFSTYLEDATIWDAIDNRTKKLLTYQIGQSSSRGVMLSVPTAQLRATVGVGETEQLATISPNFAGGLDEDATDQTTAIRRSPFRIHIVG